MDKVQLLGTLVELAIMLIPIITLFVKVGSFKKETEINIANLQNDNKELHGYYSQIIAELTEISKILTSLNTKVELYEKKVLNGDNK